MKHVEKVLIIGSGDFAYETSWLIDDINSNEGYKKFEVLGYFDDRRDVCSDISGKPVYRNVEDIPSTSFKTSFSIGDNALRQSLVAKYPSFSKSVVSIIHPSVILAPDCELGIGCILHPNATVAPRAKIGDFVILNNSSSVGHDCEIGSFSSLLPGARLGGRSKIESRVSVGTNAVTQPGITVGADSTIAPCSYVIRNVKRGALVTNAPAKVLSR